RLNRDTTRFFFPRIVDRIKRPEHNLGIVLLQNLGDGRRQRGLAMINVTDGAHVAVRLSAFKFLFRHFLPQLLAVSLLALSLKPKPLSFRTASAVRNLLFLVWRGRPRS